MADEVSDPRLNAPACPRAGCNAAAGELWCYTATGFRRHWHTARRQLAAGATVPASKPNPNVRPSHKQADMLAFAVTAGGGQYEVSGYTFAGDAQKRAAMRAMVERGWFRRVRDTDHGTLYEVTDDGKAAAARYETWMNGTAPAPRRTPKENHAD